MLERFVAKAIARFRGRKGYEIEEPLTTKELLTVVRIRFMQYMRGIKFRMFGGCCGATFVGRHVIIDHAYNFHSEPGLVLEHGVYIDALSREGVQIGRDVTIGMNTIIVCTGVVRNKGVGVKIGDRTAISRMAYLNAQGGIEIGNDVLFGPGVQIFSEDHVFSDPDIVIREQGEIRSTTVIEDDCWIGGNAGIVRGVRIGRGCVVGAGAVVTKDLPPLSVAAGVPARIIKKRGE